MNQTESANLPGTHLTYSPQTALPAPSNGPISDISRLIFGAWLRLGGWRLAGDWPPIPKAVLLAAPHTSNWDGFNMLAAAAAYRVNLKWMGKKSLTTGLFGGLVRASGCVPVDRDAKGDLVAQMAQAFKATDEMILAVAPEGTRAKTPGWRSGFYHIAHQAGVPIIFSVLDYGTRTITISGSLVPTGDYERDLIIIRDHYKDAKGRINDRYTS